MTAITAEAMRAAGYDQGLIETMEARGFFEPIDERSEVTGQIEEIEADVEGWETELSAILKEGRLLEARIRRGRARIGRLTARLATLPPDEDGRE